MTAGALVTRLLRARGIGAVYGARVAGLDVVPAPPGAAGLLAEAHGLVAGRAGATLGADRVLRLTATGAPPRVVTGVDDLVDALAPGTTGPWRLDLDLARPAPEVTLPPAPPTDRWLELGDDVMAAVTRAERPVVLAGPGVVADGAVPGLHALAAAAHVGVLNTWGAKGVFDWRSRHHLATAGLQARDFTLGGLAGADLIVATGLDGREVPEAAWRLAPAVVVPPRALSWLAERWARPAQPIPMPPLRTALAQVTQDGWAATGAPPAPTRVTLAYSRVLGDTGFVAAPGGTAGYWIARTFPTVVLGSVAVVDPVRPDGAGPGLAVAAAVVARHRDHGRPVLAVVDAPAGAGDGGGVGEVLDAARALGAAVPVQVWDPDGPHRPGEAVEELTLRSVQSTEPGVEPIATDPAQLSRMIEAAGEITAWIR